MFHRILGAIWASGLTSAGGWTPILPIHCWAGPLIPGWVLNPRSRDSMTSKEWSRVSTLSSTLSRRATKYGPRLVWRPSFQRVKIGSSRTLFKIRSLSNHDWITSSLNMIQDWWSKGLGGNCFCPTALWNEPSHSKSVTGLIVSRRCTASSSPIVGTSRLESPSLRLNNKSLRYIWFSDVSGPPIRSNTCKKKFISCTTISDLWALTWSMLFLDWSLAWAIFILMLDKILEGFGGFGSKPSSDLSPLPCK